jgi:geranylgeranyl reductase family protein
VAYSVAVIGGGPAGAMAAHAAATSGASVVLVERANLPRYKTCGGGLIGLSRRALPAGFAVPVQRSIRTVTFSYRGRWARTRTADRPLLDLVYRDEFDAALVEAAAKAGAEIADGVAVSRIDQDGTGVTLGTSRGEIRAAAVVGADGTGGRAGVHAGVTLRQVDLGLEVELPRSDPRAAGWDGEHLLIDWGPLPGSYGWVFPKRDALTVGVIAARGDGAATRAYLAAFLARLGLDGVEPTRSSGHLTRVRAAGSPLSRGRVLLAGDAAGLLEPWTREGISYALRSGAMAGAAAARLAGGDAAAAGDYAAAVDATMGEEMRAGGLLLAAFSRHPLVFHAVVATLPPAWRTFRRSVAGDVTVAELAAHRSIARALRLLA